MGFWKNHFLQPILLVLKWSVILCWVLWFYAFWKVFACDFCLGSSSPMMLNALLSFSLKAFSIWRILNHSSSNTKLEFCSTFLIFSSFVVRFYLCQDFSYILAFSCWTNIFQIFPCRGSPKGVPTHNDSSQWFSTFSWGAYGRDGTRIGPLFRWFFVDVSLINIIINLAIWGSDLVEGVIELQQLILENDLSFGV